MTATYSDFARICTLFYDYTNNAEATAKFVEKKIERFRPKKVLFIGGFFLVAKELARKGYDLTVVDYTVEMVREAKIRLPGVKIFKADMRGLPFINEFDAIISAGRVFTHMLNDEDAGKALASFEKSLNHSGILFIDNYEDSKIMKTNYFNGKVSAKGPEIKITRESQTEQISKKPFVVNWKAKYSVEENGKKSEYRDEMEHRAFSREERRALLGKSGFEVLEQGNNFDETSFYTIARKQ